jgi:hypothetical protein
MIMIPVKGIEQYVLSNPSEPVHLFVLLRSARQPCKPLAPRVAKNILPYGFTVIMMLQKISVHSQKPQKLHSYHLIKSNVLI